MFPGEWSKHGSSSGGYYSCNIYEAVKTAAGSTVSEEERSAESAKARIKRYQVGRHNTNMAVLAAWTGLISLGVRSCESTLSALLIHLWLCRFAALV